MSKPTNRRQVKKILDLRDKKKLSFRAISKLVGKSQSTVHDQYMRYRGVDNS